MNQSCRTSKTLHQRIALTFKRRWRSWCILARSFWRDVVWEEVIIDCKEIFRIAETYQGYCCAFNILKPTGASIASKVQNILKTQYFGPEKGLSVIINPLIELNAMTSVNSEGMKILVNEHNLYPSERAIERMLPHKQESLVEIRPERTDCSNAVRSLPLSDRGCVFSNEHDLKWVFTHGGCKVQTLIKLSGFFLNTWKRIAGLNATWTFTSRRANVCLTSSTTLTTLKPAISKAFNALSKTAVSSNRVVKSNRLV